MSFLLFFCFLTFLALFLLGVARSRLRLSRLRARRTRKLRRRRRRRKVAMRFPWIANQNRYALCLALNGNPDEATRQLKVIRAMHGDKTYQAIKTSWQELAHTQYAQLEAIALP